MATSLHSSTKMSLAGLGSLDSGFAAVPYSQTNKSKPPILMIPPKNPLRNSRIFPDTKTSNQSTVQQKPSATPSNLSAAVLPLTLPHHLPLIGQPDASSGTGDIEQLQDALRLSGYWDELEEFIEPSALTKRSSSSSTLNGDMKKDEEDDEQPVLPVKPRTPTHLRKRRTPSFRGDGGPRPAETTASDGTRKKRNFWSQIRKGRKSVSTVGTEAESVPPLSPVLFEEGPEKSVEDSDSSACEMHTPTSTQCPLEMSVTLGPLISIDENSDLNKSEPDAEPAPANVEVPPSRHSEAASLQPSQTHSSLSERTRKFPLLMRDKTPKHVPLDLPHALTVSIPDGKLFEDDFLDMLAF